VRERIAVAAELVEHDRRVVAPGVVGVVRGACGLEEAQRFGELARLRGLDREREQLGGF